MKMMRKIGWICVSMIFLLVISFSVYAETVDSDMPVPTDVKLSADGTVTWKINTVGATRTYVYKKFQVQLRKRFYDVVTGGGYDYYYKDYGSVKSVALSSDDGDEYLVTLEISSPGMYTAKVRAQSAEGTYSEWGLGREADAVGFDSATTNISISDGSSVASNYGPGTVYSGNSGMQVQNPYQNYGGASNIIGTNGQYITSNGQGAAYIYDNSYQNNMAYQGQSTANVGVGPGVNNGATMDTYTPGPGTNTQVFTGVSNNSVSSPNYNGMNIFNPNQIVQSGPSQSGNNFSAYTSQNWSTEVGWHVDANGFYYYQGNGVYLRNQWYLIDNNYYRFNEQGYALISKWFKDSTNGAWYYMGVDGKMLTGWQYIGGIWYYLNPERGQNFGVMFSNCSVNIGGKYYAFDSEGTCILNGYYNGNYYGADGSRQ